MGQIPRSHELSLEAQTSHGCDVELSHDDAPRPASLREAGDGAVMHDVPFHAEFSLTRPPPPAVVCSCKVCVNATSRAPQRGRVQLSACESRRLQRSHDVRGIKGRLLSPGQGYRLDEVVRYLGCAPRTARDAARRLKLLRKLPGDWRYAPLSRDQVKRLIQHLRAR